MTVHPSSSPHAGPSGPVPRAPVLLPAPVRRVEDAAQRIMVRPDGALVHRRGTAGGGADEKVLLVAQELRSAHLASGGAFVSGVRLPPGRGEWVVLYGAGRSVALSLPGWTPGQPSSSSDPLALSGVRAVLGALGHPDPGAFDLEEADSEVLAQASRTILLDPRPGPSRQPGDLPLLALRVIIVLLLTLWLGEAVVSRIVEGDVPTRYPAAALAALAVLLALPLVAVVAGPLLLRRGHRSGRGGGSSSTAPGEWTAPGGRPRITVTDEGAALLVVDPDGTATAVPGPPLGGVVEVVLLAADNARPIRTTLLTAAGEALVSLPATWWPTDQDAGHVLTVLREAGLRTSSQRVPRAALQPTHQGTPSPVVDEVAFTTLLFCLLLGLASALSRATVATLVVAATAGLALIVLRRGRWHRA